MIETTDSETDKERRTDITHQEAKRRTPGGIFVSSGMTLSIPKGGVQISIGENGGLEASTLKMVVGLDVTHHWLSIALDHLFDCEAAASELLPKWQAGEDGEQIGRLLEKEFSHGMQTISAAAFAIDAFYGSVIDHIAIPPDLIAAWRRNKTSRANQICEVLRRGFLVGPQSSKQMRDALKQIFSFRDKAVHPNSTLSEAIWHPILEVGMEWRFVVFRFENARAAVTFALNILAQITRRPKPENKALVTYSAGAVKRLDPVLERYEKQYGQLFDRAIFEKS